MSSVTPPLGEQAAGCCRAVCPACCSGGDDEDELLGAAPPLRKKSCAKGWPTVPGLRVDPPLALMASGSFGSTMIE